MSDLQNRKKRRMRVDVSSLLEDAGVMPPCVAHIHIIVCCYVFVRFVFFFFFCSVWARPHSFFLYYFISVRYSLFLFLPASPSPPLLSLSSIFSPPPPPSISHLCMCHFQLQWYALWQTLPPCAPAAFVGNGCYSWCKGRRVNPPSDRMWRCWWVLYCIVLHHMEQYIKHPPT